MVVANISLPTAGKMLKTAQQIAIFLESLELDHMFQYVIYFY